MSAGTSSAVFDRLRRSKYGYAALGWARFIDNLSRPENAEIAEIIKNDRDFFAQSEAVYAAKDIGKLRRAIKLAIGRAGAVAYMEKGKIERDGIPKPEWDWQDFTSKLIDTGLSIPKEERSMWVLNCNNNSLRKGEKIKLVGTREEYEVLNVNSAGEAKVTGPLGRISAKSEVLVWRPGSQFAEKVSDRPSTGPALKVDAGAETSSTRTNQKVESSSPKRRGEQDMANKKAATSAWQQNDGEVKFDFGMLVRRGKLTGKVIRAHGNKLRVRLDDEGGTVEWNADDESIYWRDAAVAGSADDGGKKGQAVAGKATVGKPGTATARKAAKEEPEEEEEEEEEIEEEEEPAEQEEEDEDDEIDPDDLPDSDDDLLEDEDKSQEEEEEIEEDEDHDSEEEEEEEEEEQPAGEQESGYIYTGNDIAELSGTDYQRVQKLKAQGVLNGTFIQAENGRRGIRYSFDAVDLVKNAPKNKPGRPPGGGKKKTAAAGGTATTTPRMAPATAPEKADKPRPGAPLFTPLVKPSQPSGKGTWKTTAAESPSPRPATPAASPVFTSISTPSKSAAAPISSFTDTIGRLEAEIERRENQLDRLREALQTLKDL